MLKVGDGFGKIIGWIYCMVLKVCGVGMLLLVMYWCIDDDGFYVMIDGVEWMLLVDNVVICVG